MNSTEKLLRRDTSKNEKTQIIHEIITICNYRLEEEQIRKVYKNLSYEIPFAYYDNLFFPHFYRRTIFLLDTLLKINVGMYIAIILKYYNHPFTTSFKPFVTQYNKMPKSIGFNSGYGIYKCIDEYCDLLEYYNFDVTMLDMPKEIMEKIQRYKNTKYPSIITKPAIKNY